MNKYWRSGLSYENGKQFEVGSAWRNGSFWVSNKVFWQRLFSVGFFFFKQIATVFFKLRRDEKEFLDCEQPILKKNMNY